MDRGLAETVRQQSEDLRQALKDLENWEEDVHEKEQREKKRLATRQVGQDEKLDAAAILPPVRGTVPSLKSAVEAAKQERASQNGTAAGGSESSKVDPVTAAKEEGNACFKNGKIDEAIAHYTRGIQIDPHNGERQHLLYGNRAMCYLKQEKWALAEADADMCTQMNRSYAKGYFRRAVARKNLGRLVEARKDLDSALALAPGDAAAKAELQSVVTLLRKEREQESSSGSQDTQAPKKKRVIITEVDDEDDEDEEADGKGNGETSAAAAATAEREKEAERKQKLDAIVQKEHEQLEAARRDEQERRKLLAKDEGTKMEQRMRKNNRVIEIIEEDVKETPSSAPATKPAPEQPRRHVDPSAPSHPSKDQVDKKNGEADGAQERKATHSSSASPSESKKPSTATAPRMLSSAHSYTKENLKVPKTYGELERVFGELMQKGDEELAVHYISSLTPSSLRGLFGSSLSPEVLVQILSVVPKLSATSARDFVLGLSAVSGVGDIAMFFDNSERGVLKSALDAVESGGAATSSDMSKLRSVFGA